MKISKRGFTLVELLVVIAIISVFSSVVMAQVNTARDKAYYARLKGELRSVAQAIQIWALERDEPLPPDVNRNIPNGLEQYLGPGEWPDGPWPGSVYDWDNWDPSDLDYPPYGQVYQVSLRFCPYNEPENCIFPQEEWAEDFDYHSGVYYCVDGPCRAHADKPLDHPGLCVNCGD